MDPKRRLDLLLNLGTFAAKYFLDSCNLTDTATDHCHHNTDLAVDFTNWTLAINSNRTAATSYTILAK